MTYASLDAQPARPPRKAVKRKSPVKPREVVRRELSSPVTLEVQREPHPNAFFKVPQGTKVTVQWPKL